VIVPIRQDFVRRLIPSSKEPQFVAPTRVQLRVDNVYYRFPTLQSILKRGSPLLFYETGRSQGGSRLIGEAKLIEHAVETPEDLISSFGNLGVYTLNDLRKSTTSRGANRGKALAMRFGWYREIDQPLQLDRLRKVLPKFDAQTARRVSASEVLDLRRMAGWNVAPLSFR
jgi:hypothetical protein